MSGSSLLFILENLLWSFPGSLVLALGLTVMVCAYGERKQVSDP
jgi:hypothetical protein